MAGLVLVDELGNMIGDLSINETNIKSYPGQYFTTNETLQNFVFDKVKNRGECLLEPSFGAGHLLKKFKCYNENYPMICYEIDNRITPIFNTNSYQIFVYADFTTQNIPYKFKTIIGNPPYVKQQSGNLYLKFIELCFNYCDIGGEIIFIVPSDFIKLTSASSIITKMTTEGSFTDFLFPNNERLFEGANIDILVFRYEKGLHTKTVNVNGEDLFCNVNNGIITFSKTENIGIRLSNLFNIYVGLVSGKDSIYHVPFGNTDILVDKDCIEKFIYIEQFPSNNKLINDHLLKNKDLLLERRIKKFTEKNWFTWGAPRNKRNIEDNWGKTCIYMRNMTRKTEVAFLGKVQYYGGRLICLIPKENLTETYIQNIINYLNSDFIRKDYIYSGRFKIGHRQICNIVIPTR